MKGQRTPSGKRQLKCPRCGLYYAPAGLNGHLRFYHKWGVGEKKQNESSREFDLVDETNRLKRALRINRLLDLTMQHSKAGHPGLPREGIDGVIEQIAMDYLFSSGIFEGK